MSNEAPDPSRRRFLTGAATVVGGVGAVFATVPFLGFLKPNVEAQAVGAPIEVDVSKLADGQRLEFEWKGSPVWVISRTQEHLDNLEDEDILRGRLRDPDSEAEQQPEYARNLYRSVSPEVLVVSPVCTHLGCIVVYHPEVEAKPFDDDWRGGFFCACHGAMYDMSGRVYSGNPAPKNLEIPPHRFTDDDKLVIGEDPEDPEEEVEAT
ncbi:ubiquinol-cytochrome c reductase iron-sulfur subunit [Halorhodospira halochloris]|uniref:Ubiquinol-cytochrome c reductase iron-sulfur subunit n=1 Tax=Halorhodospira halochloris TaxID=1052 RepID=A0A0X8XAL0_HALHR|nr:ubiquinol-cytochrome c reductase iron-sulfur subunit [Halorhodospira halochloris]MBK1651666.1 ubiquinol-cytochrome c reductase iron-sulfur subunit [Halorhodospira halochloris]MCG5529588.1 ubiquinol-cytochrome c reductase iron-sulfur subunit [Halorhodospira halochloris]MCG5548133.1 ubiquinol-cytochrome c reductase iron-sulfur subunit [Halorhodospira halochloris]BAU58530.1 ubiquinol-cytochrome C reductase iron-sulfur subunit [Halorhodospira halochloris]